VRQAPAAVIHRPVPRLPPRDHHLSSPPRPARPGPATPPATTHRGSFSEKLRARDGRGRGIRPEPHQG
jgi:hypothetical protein